MIRHRKSEHGLITILALLIMTALLSLSSGYINVTMREGDMVKMLKNADQAREAALAGTRLAAGALIKDLIDDGGTPYDGFDEEWFNLTNKTADGTIEPFPLDAAAGVYFHVTVIDMDGRPRFNVSNALTIGAAQLMRVLPGYSSTQANALIANNYLTISEVARTNNLGNERMTYVSPYGNSTDDSVNINTVDALDNMGLTDPPDVLNSIFARLTIAGVSVPPCASTAGAGFPGGSFAVALVRYRRGAAAGLSAVGTATTQDELLTRNSGGGHGGAYAVVQDDPHYEFGPSLRTTRVGFTPATSTGTSRVGDFCRQATNVAASFCLASGKKTYASCVMWAKEANTTGVFLIRSKGWVLKNPTTADKVDGDKSAMYQVLHIVKRTTTGYDDIFHREWWQDRQDMYLSGYTSGDYDWENTLYVTDKSDNL